MGLNLWARLSWGSEVPHRLFMATILSHQPYGLGCDAALDSTEARLSIATASISLPDFL